MTMLPMTCGVPNPRMDLPAPSLQPHSFCTVPINASTRPEAFSKERLTAINEHGSGKQRNLSVGGQIENPIKMADLGVPAFSETSI